MVLIPKQHWVECLAQSVQYILLLLLLLVIYIYYIILLSTTHSVSLINLWNPYLQVAKVKTSPNLIWITFSQSSFFFFLPVVFVSNTWRNSIFDRLCIPGSWQETDEILWDAIEDDEWKHLQWCEKESMFNNKW